MKLSIIIPVYNAEKYLDQCLKSICYQGLKREDYEVLLINDGSTDGSLAIGEKFRYQFKNYRLINQDNQGEAASRNVALKLAKGEYITFLDSDDYYECDTLNNALEIIQKGDLDILYLRLKQVCENGIFRQYIFDLPDEGSVAVGLKYERRPFPATVYRRTVIGSIMFPTGILVGPDSVFNAMVQAKAKRVSFTKKAIYNYTYRTDSLSKQGSSQEAFQGFLKAIIELRNFEKQFFADDKDARIYFDKLYIIFVTRILELNIMPGWNRERDQNLISLLKEEQLSYILDFLVDKYPYVNSSFLKFKSWQQYLGIKSAIYKLIYRA